MPLCTSLSPHHKHVRNFELLPLRGSPPIFRFRVGLDSEPMALEGQTILATELLLVIGDGKHRSLHGASHVGSAPTKCSIRIPKKRSMEPIRRGES